MTSTDPTVKPRVWPENAEAEAAATPADGAARTTIASEDEAEIQISREDLDTLQRDLDQALAKADEHWKLYLGAHAEMENLRKRTEREVQNAHKFALERFFSELLPVRDSLEMGLTAASGDIDVPKLREGVELTLKQLVAAMEKFGAREVNPLGVRFDPNLHEAMAMVPTGEAEPNTVIQVIQKGYVLNERLIRPAKVIIAQAVPKPAG